MAAKHSLGWIGMGRMGYPMAERLLKAGNSVAIWNRTRAKAEPLAKKGGQIVDHAEPSLAGEDIVFSMVSTGKDLEQVYFGPTGSSPTPPGRGRRSWSTAPRSASNSPRRSARG